MADFDPDSHAQLIGNVLKAMGALAFAIALAGLIPHAIFPLPPHFFGNGGVAAIGVLLLVSGFLMKK